MIKKTRVLIVCHDRYMSGANQALQDWLNDGACDNLDIVILLPRSNSETKELFNCLGCSVKSIPFTVPVRRLGINSIQDKIKDAAKLAWSYLVNPILVIQVAKWARKNKIDIVHSNSFATTFGAEVANRMGVPHVWHIREFCEADHGFTHYRQNRLRNLCSQSHAIFISDAVKEYQMARYAFRSSITIYDRVKLDGTLYRTRLFMDDRVCRILIVGAVSMGKGQLEAIRAVKRLREKGRHIHLYICGQGNRNLLATEQIGCEEFITDLGYRKDVNALRKDMDLALVCSRMEAFGRVTVEAQYYGNVVIGADSGCTPCIVSNGETGYLYARGDVCDLVDKIEYCMDHPSEMEDIAARAREMSTLRFSHGIACEIINLYRSLLLDEKSTNNHFQFESNQ